MMNIFDLYGNGAMWAIAPWLIPAILSAIQTGYGLFRGKGRRPRSEEYPGFGEFQDTFTPEMEAAQMATIERAVGRRRGETMGDVRELAAQRGGYRSGLLPQMEGQVNRAADQDIADAILRLQLDKAGRRGRWEELRAGAGRQDYRAALGEYYEKIGAGQGATGEGLSNLAYIAALYGRRNPSQTGSNEGSVMPGWWRSGRYMGR